MKWHYGPFCTTDFHSHIGGNHWNVFVRAFLDDIMVLYSINNGMVGVFCLSNPL